MQHHQKVLFIDLSTGYYRLARYPIGDFFGPVDLGLHIAQRYYTTNIGVGVLAGSIFPGSNRLFVNGYSPCWNSFFISSMGGAGLVFDNLGINMIALSKKAPTPSVLYLNRIHGEEIEIEIKPIDVFRIWESGHGGVYSLMHEVLSMYAGKYLTDPRVIATGPASHATDFGALCSAPVKDGTLTWVDTWAGRGGFGSKLFREHGIAAIIYGGTYIDEDFRDRKVADEWFIDKYSKKLAAKDLEATTKYRFDPQFNTGGTFGVNFATIGGKLLAFNYRSIYLTEEERLAIHQKLVVDHYLKQFNEETIATKSMKTCGEPCSAVCKKMRDIYKKDYEPYQAMGPLCGVFDQRSAEMLVHKADMYGFDAISAGGVLSWLMECLDRKLLKPEEAGVGHLPVFSHVNFSVETDSKHNAEIASQLLDAIIHKKGILDFTEGARKFARKLAREKSKDIIDCFVYNANARKGWIVPNQYWVPGVLSPMPIMGKYYMYYGYDFLPPRELGRKNAHRMIKELMLDNTGFCRFHRLWAEDMIPEIMNSLYGIHKEFLTNLDMTASRINSRNVSIYWESTRNIDFVKTYLKRLHEIEKVNDKELNYWLNQFEENPQEAAYNYWFEIVKGVHESLREF
ncbi:MAG: aldehyde ferredoxin oxidoreductase N-terminal domain-containing protein [Spirochaetota bacterium]|nr:aldehyde ferredoxin oxidoreductase N-terminal domain-containing protein [Spirochaetota bacterium]